MARKILWGTALAGWLLFTYWYTNTGGPLTQEEVEHYLEGMQAAAASRGEEANPEVLRRFLESDTGNQFLMVNLVDLKENPEPIPGSKPGATAQWMVNHYMEYMFPALLRRASHPIYIGAAKAPAMDLIGVPGAEVWEQALLMRYRSRRDLMDIAVNPEFAERHPFKVAGIEKTIAFPVESLLYPADPRFLLALVLFALCSLVDIPLRRRGAGR